MKFNSALIIGCGGIGGYLAEPLSKLLMYHKNGCYDIWLADGAEYRSHNIKRQICNFQDIGKNKAEALSERLTPNIQVFPHYVDENTVPKLLERLTAPVLVISSVDNAATRNLILDSFDKHFGNQYILVNPANGFSTIQVTTHREGLFAHPFDRYYNLRHPDDVNPGTSCEERAVGSPQLIAANMLAASITVSIVSNLLDRNELPMEVNAELYTLNQLANTIKSLDSRNINLPPVYVDDVLEDKVDEVDEEVEEVEEVEEDTEPLTKLSQAQQLREETIQMLTRPKEQEHKSNELPIEIDDEFSENSTSPPEKAKMYTDPKFINKLNDRSKSPPKIDQYLGESNSGESRNTGQEESSQQKESTSNSPPGLQRGSTDTGFYEYLPGGQKISYPISSTPNTKPITMSRRRSLG
jgi:molybdopterin/thiamine biosynthesis adenylyltransferase